VKIAEILNLTVRILAMFKMPYCCCVLSSLFSKYTVEKDPHYGHLSQYSLYYARAL
jgi:hypothetical protein